MVWIAFLPCAVQQQASGVWVHRGFFEGARQHAEAIIKVIQQAHRQEGRSLPVWVSGHSLGGAYANCLMLHLLDSGATSQLFEAGDPSRSPLETSLPSITRPGTHCW